MTYALSNIYPLSAMIVVLLCGILIAYSIKKKHDVSILALFGYFCVTYLFLSIANATDSAIALKGILVLGFVEGPVIYWATLHFTGGQRRALHWEHFAPAVACFLFTYILPIVSVDTSYIISALSRITYSALCVSLLWRVRQSADNSSWFRWISILVLYMAILAFIKIGNALAFVWLDDWSTPYWIAVTKTSGAAMIICCSLWWALMRTEIFEEAARLKPKPSAFETETFDRLLSEMQNNLLFLEPELNLTATAYKLGVTDRELSESISRCSDSSFRSILRKYRISHAKQLLIESELKDQTVLDISLQCGYATKSAFYEAFKQETGMTPTNFKKASQ